MALGVHTMGGWWVGRTKSRTVVDLPRKREPSSMNRLIICILVAFTAALRATPLAMLHAGETQPRVINPCPRQLLRTEPLQQWTFQAGTAGWTALHDCTLRVADGVLTVQSSGDDPYMISPPLRIEGPFTVKLRAKCAIGGDGQIFWMTTQQPQTDEARSEHFKLLHDDQWHDYIVRLNAEGVISQLRLDPGESQGVFQIEQINIFREILHPLEIESVRTDGPRITLSVKNYSAEAIAFAVASQKLTVAGNTKNTVSFTASTKSRFEAYEIVVQPEGLPPIHRTAFIADPKAAGDWVTRKSKHFALQVARDGSGRRSKWMGKRLV